MLAHPKLAAAFPDPAGIVKRIRVVAEVVEPTFTLGVVADEPDNRVIEAAVAARVDAVVTGDAMLLAVGGHDDIPIMSAARFLDWRHNASE